MSFRSRELYARAKILWLKRFIVFYVFTIERVLSESQNILEHSPQFLMVTQNKPRYVFFLVKINQFLKYNIKVFSCTCFRETHVSECVEIRKGMVSPDGLSVLMCLHVSNYLFVDLQLYRTMKSSKRHLMETC